MSQLQFNVVPPFEDDEDVNLIYNQLLQGWDHYKVQSRTPCDAVDWKLALMVESVLQANHVLRPSGIQGTEEVPARYWFNQSLNPPLMSMKT